MVKIKRALIRTVFASAIALSPLFTDVPVRKPFPPKPSDVVASVNPMDLPTSIRDLYKASDFRAWEPVLEELTYRSPVRSDKVFIVSDEVVKEECSADSRTAGCYRFSRRFEFPKIFLKEGVRHYVNSEWDASRRVCPRRGAIPGHFYMWLHEQGHHFDRKLERKNDMHWIDEVEAKAFQHYVAEHIEKNYDHMLGMLLLGHQLMHLGMDISDMRKSRALRWISMPEDTDLRSWFEMTEASVLILLSSGFENFGEVWHYVNTNPGEDVRERIMSNASVEGINEGLRKANALLFDMTGQEIGSPSVPVDTSILQGITLRRMYGYPKSIMRRKREEPGFQISSANYLVDFTYGEDGGINATVGFPSEFPLVSFINSGGVSSMIVFGHGKKDMSSYLKLSLTEKKVWIGRVIPLKPSYCAIKEEDAEVDFLDYAGQCRRFFEDVLSQIDRQFHEVAEFRYIKDRLSRALGEIGS